MNQPVFHGPEFEIKGIKIPAFKLESKKLVRLCLPNFDAEGNDLVHDFRYGLLSYFEKIIPKIKWSKEYSETGFRKLLKPITVEKFIMDRLNLSKTESKIIAEYLELDSTEKLNKLNFGKQKALAIKCDFESYQTLVFDYYGITANENDYLEKIVDAEIEKGKCAIAIDRLEFNQKDETNKNINRVKISFDNIINQSESR